MKPATRLAILMCCLCSCAETRAEKPPAVVALPAPAVVHAAPPQATFTIQLVNNKTREVLAGATATVVSDNGVRCVKAPCPTQQQTWEGRADAEGGVHVPPDIVNQVMTVTVKGFKPASVRRDGRRPKRVVTVRLLPE